VKDTHIQHKTDNISEIPLPLGAIHCSSCFESIKDLSILLLLARRFNFFHPPLRILLIYYEKGKEKMTKALCEVAQCHIIFAFGRLYTHPCIDKKGIACSGCMNIAKAHPRQDKGSSSTTHILHRIHN
jgi:hypothetical protein